MVKFKNKVLFIDTAPLIYFIEGHSEYQSKLEKLFESNDAGEFQFITSTITLLEVLVKPLREGQYKIAEQYQQILNSASGIDIFDITTAISIKAATLRATHNLRTPDALQIATAIERQADYFFTNDAQLKTIKEIKVVTLAELL